MTTALQPGLSETLIAGATTTGAGSTFALPAKACVLTWQVGYASTPGTGNVTLQASVDGTNFVTIDTSTTTGQEVRTITTPTSAPFIRANSVTNGNGTALTVTVIAKAYF